MFFSLIKFDQDELIQPAQLAEYSFIHLSRNVMRMCLNVALKQNLAEPSHCETHMHQHLLQEETDPTCRVIVDIV